MLSARGANLAETQGIELGKLEADIESHCESIGTHGVAIGAILLEIRDQELWRPNYASWNEYLKTRARELVGKSFTQASNLIQAAEIQKRLPEPIQKTVLNVSCLKELGRLAPSSDGNPKHRDYSRLRKADVLRVLKDAGAAPTASKLRKAVDTDLGFDRAKERAKKTRKAEKQQEAIVKKERKRQQAELEREEAKCELGNYLTDLSIRLREATRNLLKVPNEGWEELEVSKPGIAGAFAKAAKELSEVSESQ